MKELKEKCEYLALKERKERYFNYILSFLIILFLIIFIINIYGVKKGKDGSIAYTNTSSNQKQSEESFIRFIYDGFNHNNPPSKNEYQIDIVSCNNAKGSWDNKTWELKLSGIVDKVSCSLYFKKKENIIANTNVKKKVNKKENIKKEELINTIQKDQNNNKKKITKEDLIKEEENDVIKEHEEKEEIKEKTKEKILFNLDKCSSNENCNYKLIMDSNKEKLLNPILILNDESDIELNYELLSGNDAIDLFGGLVCSKNVANNEAYIKVSLKNKPEINTIVKVIVEAKLINSRMYSINRNNWTINNIEPETNIHEFISNIMNKSDNIHVFDIYNNEITDFSAIIKSNMIVRLIIDNTVYDELVIIVK